MDKFNVGFKMEISIQAALQIATLAKESIYGAMAMNTGVSLLTALQMDMERGDLPLVLTEVMSMKDSSSIGSFMDKGRTLGAMVLHIKESLSMVFLMDMVDALMPGRSKVKSLKATFLIGNFTAMVLIHGAVEKCTRVNSSMAQLPDAGHVRL